MASPIDTIPALAPLPVALNPLPLDITPEFAVTERVPISIFLPVIASACSSSVVIAFAAIWFAVIVLPSISSAVTEYEVILPPSIVVALALIIEAKSSSTQLDGVLPALAGPALALTAKYILSESLVSTHTSPIAVAFGIPS